MAMGYGVNLHKVSNKAKTMEDPHKNTHIALPNPALNHKN